MKKIYIDKMNIIQPADRISKVKEYYFSRKLKEVAAMNAAGLNVINLGIGSPDLPPSEKTITTLCDFAKKPDTHGYQPYVGISDLRQAFADWYQQWYQVSLDKNNEIQPLIGSKEGILHISMAFLNPGDAVLVPNPGYPTYLSVSNLVQANAILYNLEEKENWMPSFTELERLAEHQISLGNPIKLMWVNYPNMPTGAKASRPLFDRLVAFGLKYKIVICNDNPYSFILHEEPLSILSSEGAKDICIELNSMSKAHNMPGWRMAMLASNKQFVEWILRVKSNVDSGQFKPMQYAAVEALKVPREWYDDMNTLYRTRRKIAESIMDVMRCVYDKNKIK